MNPVELDGNRPRGPRLPKPIRLDLFCPHCGVRDVWVDDNDSGDYYVGRTEYCLTCDHEFSEITPQPVVDRRPGHRSKFGEQIYTEFKNAAKPVDPEDGS